MSNVVNLTRFIKKKLRAEAAKSADENRVKFGRTKAEKSKSEVVKTQFKKHVDGHEAEDK